MDDCTLDILGEVQAHIIHLWLRSIYIPLKTMDLDILPPGIDPWKTPALLPPPGMHSNFLNPESHANQTIVACSIVTAIMILFLVARMYTKIYLTHSVGWDDCENSF